MTLLLDPPPIHVGGHRNVSAQARVTVVGPFWVGGPLPSSEAWHTFCMFFYPLPRL
jgi:hypothetical protein